MSSQPFLLTAVALVILLDPSPLLAFCQPGDEALVAVGGRWGLEAPDGRAVIWSDSGGFQIAEVLESRTFSCFPPGSTCGTALYKAHRFCPIDWSADSRYLLASDVVGPVVPADQYDRVVYGILERGALPRRLIDPQRLWDAIEDHWLAKGRGRDLSLGGGYCLEALGWEAATTHRIVFRAWRRLTPALATAVLRYGPFVDTSGAEVSREPATPRLSPNPTAPRLAVAASDRFLGYWSVPMTGLDPRLLAEAPDGYVISRFGKYLGVAPKPPTSGSSPGGSLGGAPPKPAPSP